MDAPTAAVNTRSHEDGDAEAAGHQAKKVKLDSESIEGSSGDAIEEGTRNPATTTSGKDGNEMEQEQEQEAAEDDEVQPGNGGQTATRFFFSFFFFFFFSFFHNELSQ